MRSTPDVPLVRRITIARQPWTVSALRAARRRSGKEWWTITMTTDGEPPSVFTVFTTSFVIHLFLARLRFDPPLSGDVLRRRADQLLGD